MLIHFDVGEESLKEGIWEEDRKQFYSKVKKEKEKWSGIRNLYWISKVKVIDEKGEKKYNG